MKKRVLSLLMALTLCLSLLPTAALAEAGADAAQAEPPAVEQPVQVEEPVQGEDPAQIEEPVQVGEQAQTGEPEQNGDPAQTQTPDAPEGEQDTPAAPVENGDENENENGNEVDPVQAAQALIDALPEDVTADNADELEAQLMALDAALAALTDEQLGQLDMTRFEALCEAMTNLTAEQEEQAGHQDHGLCTHTDTCSCPEGAKKDMAFTDAVALTAKDGELYIGGKKEQLSTTSSCYELSEGSYYLEDNIELSYTIRILGNTEVNLCLNGHSITKNADDRNDHDGVIRIENGGTLSLCDCNGSNAGNGKITHAKDKIGRGVRVGDGTSGNGIPTFNMFGGEISGNHAGETTDKQKQDGAGVHMQGGNFNMYGGKITDNYVDVAHNYGGGGVCMSGGSFTMYDGEISGNTSAKYGGGVAVTYSASFVMQGGTISGNKAATDGGGVYIYNGTFTLSDKAIITGNTATSGNGGGVY
mgnify:CR=1 FL=1